MKPKFAFNMRREIFDLCFDEETAKGVNSLVEIEGDIADTNSAKDLKKNLSKADGCIAGWDPVMLTKEILDHAPNLKIVLFSGGSVKPLVSDEMWRRGIRVTSAAIVNAIPVAEFTLGMILGSLKHVFRFHYEFKEKGSLAWRRPFTYDAIPGYYRSTVGIIGMGHIGRYLLKLLQPFDFNIVVCSRYFPDEHAERSKAKKVPLEELMSISDVVTLHAADTPQNRHMINRRMLSRMKDGAVIINTSRATLIDEKALIDELRSGRISACLDVFKKEPPEEGSEFYRLPNCVITPHIAGSINRECYRLGHQVLKELKHYLAGEDFEYEVTRDMIDVVA